MKLIKALLSANLTTLFAKISCNAPPDLGKGIWNCENNNSYNHGETCDISGDDCTGTIKCWKGNWKGKTSKFCPKDCIGTPRQPGSGGSFECETEDYRTCELKPWNGFECSSSVVCNTKKGSWTGKAKCSFQNNAEVKKNPPARPNGKWSCTNKCRFTCNDGRKAGSGKIGKLGWVFSSDWNFCCPDSGYEFGCDNGIVGKSDVCPDESSTSVDVCERCDVGYDLVGTECALKGLSTTTITTPNHFTTVQTSNAPTTAPPTTAFTTTAPTATPPTTEAHITTTSILTSNNEEVKNNPPARPNGEWSCTNKCRFTCNDGRRAGYGKVGMVGWVLSKLGWGFSNDWNFCCPDSEYEFSCDNGIVKTDVCPDESSTGYHLVKYENDVLNQCVANQCLCDNGTPASGKHCLVDGAIACEFCDSDYLMSTEGWRNICWSREEFPTECGGPKFLSAGKSFTSINSDFGSVVYQNCEWELDSGRSDSLVVVNFVDQQSVWVINHLAQDPILKINQNRIVHDFNGRFASVENKAEVIWESQASNSFEAEWDYFYPCESNKCCSGSGEENGYPVMLNLESGKCELCSANQFLNENRICEDFTCVCPNGVPADASGPAVFRNEHQIDRVAYPHDESDSVNESGPFCSAEGSTKCRSCGAGFKNNGVDECVVSTQNVCNCERGTPSTGSKCEIDGENRCHSCDYPFALTCTRGGRSFNETQEHLGSNETTSHRHKRDTHGSSGGSSGGDYWWLCERDSDNTHCNACQHGYKWNRKTITCTAYLCSCPNGTPTVGTGYDNQVCNGNGKPRCDSCDDGFELSEHRNVWTCQPV